MNVFVTSLLKIINNPDIQDTNYNIAYYLLLHYYDVFEMTLQEIADACYVSVSTLNRFFRIFGPCGGTNKSVGGTFDSQK